MTHPPRPSADDTTRDRDAEHRTPPPDDQNGHPSTSGAGTSGDLDASDIVGPFGEEMPVQSHDEPG